MAKEQFLYDSDQVWKRWLLGVVAPLVVGLDGLRGLVLRTTSLDSRQAHYVVYGQEAITASCGFLAAAIGLHVYFFWENRERLAGYREIVLAISILVLLGSMGRFLYLDFRP